MNVNARGVLTRNVRIANPDETIHHAALAMADIDAGVLSQPGGAHSQSADGTTRSARH
jgi:hypothetical protein